MSVFFYLDDATRSEVRSDITAISSECTIIYELVGFEENDTLIYTEASLKNLSFVHKVKVLQKAYNLDCIMICKSYDCVALVSDFSRYHICDFSLLNLDMIQAAIYATCTQTDLDNLSEEKKLLSNEKASESEKNLVTKLLLRNEALQKAEEKIDRLEENVKTLTDSLAIKQEMLDSLLSYYDKIVQKSIELNNSIEQYKIIFSKDVYNKVNCFKYKNRPKIIYIKEYQELLGMYELLYILRTALYKQVHLSCKVVLLMNSNASMRSKSIPQYYKQLLNKFTRSDIYKNDFICSIGDYSKILSLLMENALKLDVIIVCDCLPHADITLQDVMLQYAFCRDAEVAKKFALNSNTVTNSTSDEFITYEPFNLQEDSFVKCSSSQVIRQMLGDFEEFSASI